MHQLNDFETRAALDVELAEKVADLLSSAIKAKGSASIAVSGGSTPKGFFEALSQKDLPWRKVTVTLADERWVNIDSNDSNTRLVHENLLVNKAKDAKFFHLKQGEELCAETLADLNVGAENALLPLDVLILGMGEDGHTASLFPCSQEIEQALALDNSDALMKVVPTTAPHDRITFTYATLLKSANTFLHISSSSKKAVLEQALSDSNILEMPIRAFLQHPDVNVQVYWAE
ncbi:6-phosphogluconolactonase [Thalassotalea sp. PLHSN55]|uniref:6-phosphogluconolactonase n=1 Tax=Thalassotalea sp. PLHSN55 TaxID=3435888 RepID=UPI003F850B4E